ncbi:hypothetical protein EAE99_000953 [Botrytis elliptica]|nr:hypothetical protein EAE99_000953 [Botrytis elliptica]
MRNLPSQLLDELFRCSGGLLCLSHHFTSVWRKPTSSINSEALKKPYHSNFEANNKYKVHNYEIATMGVPFEALLPYGIMLAMFGITGAGMSGVRALQNGGKRARHSVDAWDRVMMDRDRRLTGFLRGQTDNPSAPLGFELNNPWRLEKRFI